MRDKPGTGTEAIGILESAMQLLRHASLETLLSHWTGSVPFAIVILAFWNDATQYRTSASTCALDAALAAAALAWMSCWRALYAGRLRSRLSGEPFARPPLRALISSQVFLNAAKLVAIPIGLLTIVGFANVVAFFRFGTVLAGENAGRDVFQIMRESSRLARIESRRVWYTMLFAWMIALAVFLNIAITLVTLPMLFHMLTGIETQFSRMGTGLTDSPLFWGSAFAVSWLAADPFIQAVYCVLCFRAESASTGEDLRAVLRRLGEAAAVAVGMIGAILLFAATGHAETSVSPDSLHDSLQKAMQSHEYDWRLPADAPAASKPSWIVTFAQNILQFLGKALKAVGRLLRSFIDWIFKKLSIGLPTGQAGTAPAAALHWSVYVLTAVVLALAGFLIWRMIRTRRRKVKAAPAGPVQAVSLHDESVTADRLPEDKWIEMAEERLRNGDYRLAVRAFYLANLAFLGRIEIILIHAGKTNREYENEFRRRARGSVEARELFGNNLAAFERVWYGLHEVDAAAVEEFRSRNQRIKAILDLAREAAA